MNIYGEFMKEIINDNEWGREMIQDYKNQVAKCMFNTNDLNNF